MQRISPVRLAGALALVVGSAVVTGIGADAGEIGADDVKLTSGQNPRQPEISQNPSTGEYLVVWEQAAAGPSSISAMVVSSTGLAGVPFTVASHGALDAIEPEVDWNPTDGNWVVVYAAEESAGAYEIYATEVSAAGVPAAPVVISSMGDTAADASFDARRPDVAHNTTTNEYFVVWDGDDDGDDTFGSLQIFGQRLSNTLSEVGTDDVRLTTNAAAEVIDDAAPAIEYSGGGYGVAFESLDFIGSVGPVRGITFQQTAVTPDAPTTPVELADTLGLIDGLWPEIASDGTDFVIVFEGFSTSLEVYGASMTGAGAFAGASPLSGAAAAGKASRRPAVGYNATSSNYAVAWHGTNPATLGSAETEVFSTIVDTALAPVEPVERISTMGTGIIGSPAGAAVAPASGASFITVWSSDNPDAAAGPDQTVLGDHEVFGQFVSETADLAVDSVTLTSSTTPPPGAAVAYDVSITNNGPADANGVEVSVVVPTGLVLGGVTAGNTLTVNVGALANSATQVVPVVGTVASGAQNGDVAAITATVTGSPDLADPSGDNTGTSGDLTVDAAPTVAVEQAAAQADPTNVSPVNFTATFSEDVSGFATGDVTLGGTAAATTAVVTGGPDVYNIAVSGMTGPGTVIATVAAGVASDLDATPDGNEPSTSSDNMVTFDDVDPTVTIEQAAAQADPTNGATVNFTATFTEPVTGFDETDISDGSTAPGTPAIVVTGGPSVYNVAYSGYTGDGNVQITIDASAATDAAGNSSEASTSTDNLVEVDRTDPTVTVDQAAGQADPTNAEPVEFTVVFSEDVTGFGPADVTLGGTAAPQSVDVTGGPSTFTLEVSGMTGDGTVTAVVGVDAGSDSAGNTSEASTSTDNEVTFDQTSPTVTIEQGAVQDDSTNASPIVFDIVFSEDVTGFDGSDVVMAGTAGATTAVVSGGPAVYTVDVSGMTGDGTVSASIGAGAGTDAAGNTNEASTSTDNLVTYIMADPNPGLNDPPSITAPAAVTAELAEEYPFAGTEAIVVTDPDALNGDLVVTITIDDGVLAIGATTGLVANVADMSITLTGELGDLNAALATITATVDNVGTAVISIDIDDQGNTSGPAETASATIDFVVEDTTPPTLIVPGATVEATTDPGQPGAVVTFEVTATDPGSDPASNGRLTESEPAPTIVCDPGSGDFFPIGETSLSCTATDSSGNASSDSFLVDVVDDENPVITGAADQTVTLPSGSSGSVSYVMPTATDNSGSATIACSPVSGSTMSAGANSISCTARDASGNTTTDSFVVTVNATELPATGGGGLWAIPWALSLLGVGAGLTAVAAYRRRLGRAQGV